MLFAKGAQPLRAVPRILTLKDMSALEPYEPIPGYARLGGRAAFRAEKGRCASGLGVGLGVGSDRNCLKGR